MHLSPHACLAGTGAFARPGSNFTLATTRIFMTASPLSKQRVAIISASWHTDIVHQARDSALASLREQGLADDNILLLDVPGAFEIPLLAKRLATEHQVDAIIACALVVNGGIYRHEFVASAVIDGLMRVQLDTNIPVLSAVLTPRDFHETDEHKAFFREHFVKKGREVAAACVAVLRL
jgi:6,7-dimethyl-8-ribityllumazine synthase